MSVSTLPIEGSSVIANRLLASLPRDEYAHLLPRLEFVKLPKNRILYEAGDPIHYGYFLKTGMVSFQAITDDGQTIDIGMVGNEGFLGDEIFLQADRSSGRATTQFPCEAVRIEANALLAEFLRGGKLQEMLLRYTHVTKTQLAQAVPCNLFHSVEERFARRLLVTSDCLGSDTFEMTQEQLGIILSRHRIRISAAIVELKERGLVEHSR
ncbi:MAG: Crp/Fnr family transcriptional regulator, partial [Pyrinomonadaceae bacterium]